MIQIELPSFDINSSTILKHASFQFIPGAIYGIFGKSGAGKSMLLKIMSGRYKHKAVISNSENSSMHVKVSLFPSDKEYLHEETITELINSGKIIGKNTQRSIHNHNEEKKSIISFLGLTPFMEKKLGEVHDTVLKKAYLAKTLTENSDIYLLDSPETSLDINSKIQISRLLKHLSVKKAKIIIVASNSVNFLTAISDSYIALKSGEVISTGKSTKLTKEILESVYESNLVIQKNVVTGKIEISFYHQV